MEAGADLGAFNSEVNTAMDVAASRKNLLIECYLRTKGAPTSSMFWDAADSGPMNPWAIFCFLTTFFIRPQST